MNPFSKVTKGVAGGLMFLPGGGLNNNKKFIVQISIGSCVSETLKRFLEIARRGFW